ncbi:hypothetical protein F4819DRAFT_490704 [Hypoxylon fuscum]|nr:hypothetical protein F4819DRAFT_490704 [Hypoxylon fuscum]
MASPNTAPGMVALAAKISSSVAELQELLSAQGLPSPSFAKDCDAVLDATSELHELLLEPMSLVFKFSAISNLVSIDAICQFHIADMIPLGGQVSFGDISKKTGLEEPFVKRLLRHAMAMRILRGAYKDFQVLDHSIRECLG